jgi:hypothetical protein
MNYSEFQKTVTAVWRLEGANTTTANEAIVLNCLRAIDHKPSDTNADFRRNAWTIYRNTRRNEKINLFKAFEAQIISLRKGDNEK